MQQEKNATHWVLGGALLLIGLFVIIALVLVRSEAATTVTLSVTSVAPTVTDLKICAGATANNYSALDGCSPLEGSDIHPGAGASIDYDFVFEVTDANGTDDLAGTATVALYHSGQHPAVSATCLGTSDDSDCYQNIACTKYTDGSTKAIYACTDSFKYYALPSSSWSLYATVLDGDSNEATQTDTNITVGSVVSAAFDGAINFGGLALGTTTAGTGVGGEEVGSDNLGNVVTDYTVLAGPSVFTCDVGTFPVGSIEFGTTNVGYGNHAYSLSSTAATSFNLDIPISVTGTAGAATSYWDLSLPSTGLEGACSATMEVTAVESV